MFEFRVNFDILNHSPSNYDMTPRFSTLAATNRTLPPQIYEIQYQSVYYYKIELNKLCTGLEGHEIRRVLKLIHL